MLYYLNCQSSCKTIKRWCISSRLENRMNVKLSLSQIVVRNSATLWAILLEKANRLFKSVISSSARTVDGGPDFSNNSWRWIMLRISSATLFERSASLIAWYRTASADSRRCCSVNGSWYSRKSGCNRPSGCMEKAGRDICARKCAYERSKNPCAILMFATSKWTLVNRTLSSSFILESAGFSIS